MLVLALCQPQSQHQCVPPSILCGLCCCKKPGARTLVCNLVHLMTPCLAETVPSTLDKGQSCLDIQIFLKAAVSLRTRGQLVIRY